MSLHAQHLHQTSVHCMNDLLVKTLTFLCLALLLLGLHDFLETAKAH